MKAGLVKYKFKNLNILDIYNVSTEEGFSIIKNNLF